MRLHNVFLAGIAALFAGPALAAGNLAFQEAIPVEFDVGRCQPAPMTFETGKLYDLTILNSDDDEADFAPDGFASRVFTRKIEVWDTDGGKIAEIKGAITALEIPGDRAVHWWFVPVQTTRSTIKVECESATVEWTIE
ncbi:MAG: hypothetical protein O2905_03080 [Proteobacteria bacterium]|nr:hypothetical protein [Pseudomonadota bacterium]